MRRNTFGMLTAIAGAATMIAVMSGGSNAPLPTPQFTDTPDITYFEMMGIDLYPSGPTVAQELVGAPLPPDAESGKQPPGTNGPGAVTNGTLLLIPESTNDRVMAFDATTGDLVNADYIPADPDNLSTPISAIVSASGTTILVSDQLDDVVQEYDMSGVYLGVFAPAGGADTSILDNIRGIALLPNGNLLVTVGSGANQDAVAEFDTSGNYLGNFIANGAGGLDSPFDVYVRATDVLVGGISSDAIHRYDLAGNYLDDLTPINTFPEQINEAVNANVLVGNFSGTEEGIVEYMPDGTFFGLYDPASLGGYRGVFELGNGNILTTNGGGVHEIDRSGNVIETKISGVSARFIEVTGPAGPVGACCLVDGSCVETSSAGCDAQGGVYEGDDTLCADTTCPPAGACCFFDGSCALLIESACLDRNGIHQGDMTDCMTVVCEPCDIIYDNGPLVTNPGAGCGGADLSALQAASLGMNTLGVGHQAGTTANRIADDFTLAEETEINGITFYAYQTGSSTSSSMTSVNLQIWDGVPGDPGSNVVFGDTSTNVMLSTAFSGIYRATDDNAMNCDRPIMAQTVAVYATLPAGTYWLDWATGGSLSSGPWAPPISILGQPATGDGLQSLDDGVTWAPVSDSGTLDPQGFPFQIYGPCAQEIEIALDIKPGSCPNSYNRKSQGKLPVALLGSMDFDVTLIDWSTIELGRADGVGGTVMAYMGPPGPEPTYEDVATPYDGDPCGCHELHGDGYMDLSLKFDRPDMTEALLLEDLYACDGLVEIVVTGELTDGTLFFAIDCLRFVPPGDCDDNGVVNVDDMLSVLAAWGQTGVTADQNGDGLVNADDFLDVLAHWNACY